MKLSKTDLEVVYAFKGYMFCAGNEYLDLAWLPTTIITGSELWTIGSQPFWVISRSTRNIPPWGRGRLSVTRSSTFCCKDGPSKAWDQGWSIWNQQTAMAGRERKTLVDSTAAERDHYKANYCTVSLELEPWDLQVTCQLCAEDIQPR